VDQRLGNRQLLEKLELRIKTAMESFVGGDKRFQNVFENVSQTDKKAILATLKKMNPEGFKKVRKNLIVFDDIKRLDAEELKLILSDANVDLVAQALVSVDQDLYQKVYESLTKNARNMVAQYLELKSNSTSKKDIEHAQNYILKIAMALDESGHISLRSKLGGGK
jgi:flagellar motor switch protein FliG